MSLCDNCDKSGMCNTNCPEREWEIENDGYINQDYVPQSELTVTELGWEELTDVKPWPEMVEEYHFTQRECEVLGCVARGLTRSETARSLNISDSRLRGYISEIRAKIARF